MHFSNYTVSSWNLVGKWAACTLSLPPTDHGHNPRLKLRWWGTPRLPHRLADVLMMMAALQ
jgi:hypothetical protein